MMASPVEKWTPSFEADPNGEWNITTIFSVFIREYHCTEIKHDQPLQLYTQTVTYAYLIQIHHVMNRP